MNLYLDIDGTIITEQGIEANYLYDFLCFAIVNYDCYWLTTHCKGDASNALEYVKDIVSPQSFELLKKFKATNWNLWKTEGIDYDHNFVWLDDYVFDSEIEVLKEKDVLENLIKIDLKSNPDQLLDIVNRG